MNVLMTGYPAMTAAEAAERYGRVYHLLDGFYCDLPEHRFSLSDNPDSNDNCLCCVPIRIGKATGYLNIYPFCS